MAPAAPVPAVRAGRVSSPHGLDGSVKVADPIPALLVAGAEVLVGDVATKLVRRSGTDQKPIVRFQGCDSREAAEALRGSEIRVPRDVAPELGEGEFWTVDLIGLRAVDGTDDVGEVVEVIGLPSCEVLEVERTDGARISVPLVSDAVRHVDVDGGTVDINLGFLGER